MTGIYFVGCVFLGTLYLCLVFAGVWRMDHWIERQTGSFTIAICIAIPTLVSLIVLPFAILQGVL